MPASSMYDGVQIDGDRALALAFELHMMNLEANSGLVGEDNILNFPSSLDDVRAKKSQNMTECVPVPSSEHVAEIVGRQGCKIKALRAKTNTYIKTPVRGEEPVFVVTGRKEDVAKAKREILSAADHFSQIRASRKSNFGGLLGLSPPGPPMNVPGQITIQVRVPYRVVGLVVGPKGATIKRIQQTTHTYIVTPSRDKEPVFEVTGQPENVENARQEIEAHIAVRTGAAPMQGTNLAELLPLADESTELLNSIYKTGLGSIFNIFDSGNAATDTLALLSSASASASSSSAGYSSSGSISSSSSSSGGRLTDMGSIWSSSLDRDEGIGDSPTLDNNIWAFPSTRPSPAASASPTESLNKRECLLCTTERDVNAALVPCGHTQYCYECASRLCEGKNPTCPICGRGINQVIRILS